ncbi:MAG: DUF4384 domain-containing protein [Alphaproteobacteria bacterium]|nr:DUF4384 domain-containing protein [Alphaproteobacteria bacterium]
MRPNRLHAVPLTRCAGLIALVALIALSGPLHAQAPLPQRATDTPAPGRHDPLEPTDKMAARVFAVFDRDCARCHDTRRLKRRLPAGGIANILDLDAIARRRDLVRPGYPEGSPLYVSMVTRHMPFDVLHDLEPGAEPTANEVADVYAWIAGMSDTKTCNHGLPLPTDLAERIARDLARLDEPTARGRRYLSLAGIASSCDDAEALKRYADAAMKLVNFLSRGPRPVRAESLGGDGLLVAFDLEAVGWSPSDWDWLQELAPARPATDQVPGGQNSRSLLDRILPAGWLAHQAMAPAVYAHLTGLPATLPELFASFHHGEGNVGETQSYRIEASPVTGGRRQLARLLTSDGRILWTARDVNPSAAPDAQDAVVQTRAIFALPNGLPAFALYNRDGTARIDVHASALAPAVAQSGATGSALGCIACHDGGLAAFEASQGSGGSSPGGWQVRRDNALFQIAERSAGLQRDLRIDGMEPVTALAQRYRRDLGLATAAAELGRTPGDLAPRLRGVEGALRPTARRLLQGLVTRAEFEALRAELSAIDAARNSATTPPQTPVPSHDDELRLSLWTDKAGYAKGEPAVIHAASTAPCHLSLIWVDQAGDAVVVFPSEFQEENLLQPGSPLSIPGPGRGFRLRVDEPDQETIIGICMAGDRNSPPGILHDHELQPFTLLGHWREHISRSLEADAKERSKAGKTNRKTRSRRRRGRRIKSLPVRADKRPLAQDWALVVIPAGNVTATIPPAGADTTPAVSRESGHSASPN